MKSLGFLLSIGLSFALSSTANAETYTSLDDPSGAPMCFDTTGGKAQLSSCKTQTLDLAIYESRVDPSGAKMCFRSTGQKAPLIKCEAQDILVASVAKRDEDLLVASTD